MKKFQRMCAATLLTVTLAVSALAGQIPSPGYVPPPPPGDASTSTSGNITTTIILTILSLIR